MSLSMPTIGMHANLPIPVPVELLQCILQQIDDCQTLSLLALVCRVFYLEANMILYRSPRNIKPLRHIQFLSSLVGNPRLACLVRSYKLPFIAGKQRITYLELLRITLPLMVNLKELSIMAANEIEVLSVARLTIQIENVSWIQLDSGQNDQFVRWAQSQKSTKHLRWIHKKAVEVPRSAFPSLVSLEGNLHVVEALMPDRDIRRLHWIADSLSGEFLVTKALAVKMANLKSLTFEIRFNAVDYNTIAGYFHSLTFLELIRSFRKSVSQLQQSPFEPNVALTWVKGYGDNSHTAHLADLGILGPRDT